MRKNTLAAFPIFSSYYLFLLPINVGQSFGLDNIITSMMLNDKWISVLCQWDTNFLCGLRQE